MKLFYTLPLILTALLLSGCSTAKLSEPYASDFTTSGPLGDDCFQVVVKAWPEKEALTMHERRETAYIRARKNLYSEAEKQITAYISSSRQISATGSETDNEKIMKKAASYSDAGILEQEFYLIDDSVVLIYRIYRKGIKNELSGN